MSTHHRFETAAAARPPLPPNASRLARIKAEGVLRIGTTGDYVPFSVEEDGELSGADIELATQLAQRLGVAAIFVRTSWDALLADLHADRFDIGLSGISISPKRKAVAAFSTPYFWVGEVILTRCRTVSRYPDLASLDRPEVRVLVYPGGTGEHFAHAHLQRAQIIPFPDKGGAFDEIRAGRVDAMFTDEVDARVRVRTYPDLCYTLADSPVRDPKAILLPHAPDLVAAVDAWVSESVAAGEPPRLIEQHLRRFIGA